MTVYVKPAAPSGLLIALGTVIPILIPLYFTLGPLFGPMLKNAATTVAAESGIPIKQTFPIQCGVNQEVAVIGQTYEGSGTLITGEVNCKIKIKNSKLKADVVAHGKNLVEITVENSTLEGKENAVKLGTNSKLFARAGSVLKGEEAGVVAGINSEVTLDQSAIEGGTSGLVGEINAKLYGTKSRITGKDYGFRASTNATVEGRELTISGERAALEADSNLKLELRGGLFQGNETAVRAKSSNANVKLFQKARLTAKETALEAKTNLSLEMEDALVDGGEIGVEAGTNPKLSLGRGARVVGKEVGLKVGVNLELDMRGASIESDAVAICGPYNARVRARDSVIRGNSDAFRLQRRPLELAINQTTVSGSQLFSVQGCAPSRKR